MRGDGCWSGGRTGERWKGHRDVRRGHCGEQEVRSVEGQADMTSFPGCGSYRPTDEVGRVRADR